MKTKRTPIERATVLFAQLPEEAKTRVLKLIPSRALFYEFLYLDDELRKLGQAGLSKQFQGRVRNHLKKKESNENHKSSDWVEDEEPNERPIWALGGKLPCHKE